MSLVRLAGVVREVGTLVILDGIDAPVAAGERIGLVGPNGAGKTTLLRIVAGADLPDRGDVNRRRGLTIGLLAQEAHFDEPFVTAPTLRVAVRRGARELEQIERELAELEAGGRTLEPRYAELQARFEAREGYSLDQRVDATLTGLGFTESEWSRSPAELSGGQQTRASLARLLIADPDLLLLDEPTNHLDLAALEWLEEALRRRPGAVIVASHDRAFLDATVTRIWELRDRHLTVFRGDYSAYARQREERDARLRKDAERREGEIAREQELVQRYRSHRKYSKMHEHEARLERLDRIEVPRAGSRMALSSRTLLAGPPARSADVVVRATDLAVGYPPGVVVTRAPLLEARRGERIGIVGPNGAGKTTLLRTIAGELSLLDGRLVLGSGVGIGYLAQLRDAALPGETVLEALLAEVPLPPGEARGYLARFLFRGDDVFKEVRALSGGERSRLELALLGVMPANLLLLDEPTNHLDIPAREALESFLRETPSTILIVSHDRRFLETVCEALWVVDDRTAVPFAGGYRAWRGAVADGWTVQTALTAQADRARGLGAAAGVSTKRLPVAVGEAGAALGNGRSAGASSLRVPGRPQGRQPKLSKDLYRRQKGVIEADLTRLGLRKSHLELALGDSTVGSNFVELRRITSELADVDQALSAAEEAWLLLEERAP